MLAHRIATFVNGSGVRFVLVVIFALVVFHRLHLSAKGGKAGVVHADRVHGGHAKTAAWRADCFHFGSVEHVFDKVAGDRLIFQKFGLCLHG